MIALDITIWLIVISVWMYGLFTKNQFYILIPLWGIVIYSLIILAYSSIFQGASFSNWFQGLRLSVFFSLMFCMIVYLTSVFKYTEVKHWGEGDDIGFLSYFLVFLGLSYIFGSTFLNYGNSQYIIAVIYFAYAWLFFAFKGRVTQKNAPLFAILALNVSVLSFIGLYIMTNSQINLESARDTLLSYTQPTGFLFIWVLLALSKFDIIEEKHWSKLKKVFITIVLAGLTFHHPEITKMNTEFINYAKNIVAISDVSAVGYIAYITSKAARLYV